MRAAPFVGRLLLVVAIAACAREEPPPGTDPEQRPPAVRRLEPPSGANVPAFSGAAKLRFNEPISNPRGLVRQLVTSPAGDYDVRPNRTGIDVRPEDGWQDGVVYYFQIPAGVSDLLRNRTTEPVEWIFRLGGPVPSTEVSGRLVDRVTGRGHRSGTLVFRSADSIPYTAVSDTGGVYRLPGLPPATYVLSGFVDQDRDYVHDMEFEPGGSLTFELIDGETLTGLDVIMLPADTTPPVVASARQVDATRVQVTFDDPLDDADTTGVRIAVRGVGDAQPPSIDTWAFGSLEPAEDEVPIDEPGEDGEVEEPEQEPVPPVPALDPAPTTLTIRFVAALAPGEYEVQIDGVPNLRGLVGGGSAEFQADATPLARPEAAEMRPEPEAAEEGAEDDVEP